MPDELTNITAKGGDMELQENWCFQQQKAGVLKNDAKALFAQQWPNSPQSRKTFDRRWKKGQERYAAYREIEDKAIQDVSLTEAVDAAKRGLKSKLERQLQRQAIIDDILDKIHGRTQHYFITGKGTLAQTIQADGKVMIPGHVLKDLNLILHIHQSALEKTSGDIVEKKSFTDPTGEVAAPIQEVPPLTDDQVDKILAHFKAG